MYSCWLKPRWNLFSGYFPKTRIWMSRQLIWMNNYWKFRLSNVRCQEPSATIEIIVCFSHDNRSRLIPWCLTEAGLFFMGNETTHNFWLHRSKKFAMQWSHPGALKQMKVCRQKFVDWDQDFGIAQSCFGKKWSLFKKSFHKNMNFFTIFRIGFPFWGTKHKIGQFSSKVSVKKRWLRHFLRKHRLYVWQNSGLSYGKNQSSPYFPANSIHESSDAKTNIDEFIAEGCFAN